MTHHSPRILAIDTTGEFGSIALSAGCDVQDEILLHSPDGFGHILFEHLDRMLRRHSLTPRDIDCFAAGSGPGSFTGVRVGLSAAKGLAEACGKPLVAISNLQAVAEGGRATLRAALLDARRGEVYAALYNAALEPVLPETVGKFAVWLDTLPEEQIEFLSIDTSPFQQALEGMRFAGSQFRNVPRALAPSIARLAVQRFQAGAVLDPAAADANYVRRADAELLGKS